jgi:hypothetical protein
MDSIIANLVTVLVNGGQSSISALLVTVLIGLLWDRVRIMHSLEQAHKETARIMELKDAKADEVVRNYFKSSLATADALNSLKMVLNEINMRLTK